MSAHIPKEMNPVDILDKRTLTEMATCPQCEKTVPVMTGVLYDHIYPTKEGPAYLRIFFCSYECILKALGPDGNA